MHHHPSVGEHPVQSKLLRVDERLATTAHVANHSREINVRETQRLCTGVDSREREQAVEETAHPFGLVEDFADGLAILRLAAVLSQRQLRGRAHERDRRPQLVRCIRRELRDTSERYLEPIKHLVERFGETLQFVA